MKRGNIRTHKDYKHDGWKIQGRKNGLWIDVWDEEREKQGLTKDLIFDLEYDACGYLLGFVEWMASQSVMDTITDAHKSILNKGKGIRKKRKAVKQAKRRNRKK